MAIKIMEIMKILKCRQEVHWHDGYWKAFDCLENLEMASVNVLVRARPLSQR